MKISRRNFVAGSSSFILNALPFINQFSTNNCGLLSSDDTKTLVIIHLAGGNDWLNTIIPYGDKSYYARRPSLAIPKGQVLKLNEQYGFHPALPGLKSLFDKKQIAILLNGGCVQEKLSHHRALENMRYVPFNYRAGDVVLPAINVEPKFNLEKNVLISKEAIFISSLEAANNFKFNLDSHYCLSESSNDHPILNTSIENLSCGDFVGPQVRRINNGSADLFPDGFSIAMNFVAKSIVNKVNMPAYHISLGGFDLHVDQGQKHAHLLHMLDRGIYSFQEKLKNAGMAERVLTVICSEFGRSLDENAAQGTEHGYLNHVITIGASVKGGLSNNQQS